MNILKNSLSKIALIIGALTLFGCAEIASLAISQGESVDKSRVEASQSYGYIARFSENPATKNSIYIKDLSLVYNKEAITLKMIIVNPGTQNQSVISVFESPTYRMHVAEMELFDKDNVKYWMVITYVYPIVSARAISIIPDFLKNPDCIYYIFTLKYFSRSSRGGAVVNESD